jgi:hypothetical protein
VGRAEAAVEAASAALEAARGRIALDVARADLAVQLAALRRRDVLGKDGEYDASVQVAEARLEAAKLQRELAHAGVDRARSAGRNGSNWGPSCGNRWRGGNLNPGLVDRQRGCLLGLAIGDALGAAVEFRQRGSFEPVVGYRAGGPHGLAAGEWTDDTSLALADSIATLGWDLDDQARRYVAWWRTGRYSVNGRCFDIGHASHRALAEFERHGDARASGDPSPHASDNGSIMRLAPRFGIRPRPSRAPYVDDQAATL